MLSKPVNGWTEFQLDGTSVYALSYLDDIAFAWIDEAIHGMEQMQPFCVKGFLEPNRFLCVVSYWNCHITIEDDERAPLNQEDVYNEYSHTSMLQFCEFLYQDIQRELDKWVSFVDYGHEDFKEKKERLVKKLTRLEELISEKRECFGENRCFL